MNLKEEHIKEIQERLSYLEDEIDKGTEDMEEYYEAVGLHKELCELIK